MAPQNKQLFFYTLFKWLLLVASYAFLAYKLITFEQYPELASEWVKAWSTQLFSLVLVLTLLPFNWLLETYKWKFLVRKLETLSLRNAFKSVMIGNTTAFFTPNRLGEFPGRTIGLKKGNKLQGMAIGVLGSLSQTLTIMLFGIPAAWMLFFYNKSSFYQTTNYYVLAFIFTSLLCAYYFLPQLCGSLKNKQLFRRIENLLHTLSQFSYADLTGILLLSIVRYVIFCTQFYYLLHFFGIHIEPLFGAIGIAANYLFITFAPSMAFSEGAVRASVAILTIGVFTPNTVGIALTGLFIWLINFVLPMFIGSLFLGRKK